MTLADEAGFAALARRISQRAGFAIEAYKDRCVRRRIAVRMRACGVHTYRDYHAILDASPSEVEHLRDALTINVTRFYRNAETWRLLRRDVIPRLFASTAAEVRVWSAGCSSGEEPYTLAILAAEHLDAAGRSSELERLVVDATDVDRASLERARTARYRAQGLTELPPQLADRYLERVDQDLQVTARIRSRVLLSRADLTTDPPPGRDYRLVLCRNVLIYFDRPTQERLLRIFVDSVAPDGFLVLGKVESLVGPARHHLTLVDPRERIYRRPA